MKTDAVSWAKEYVRKYDCQTRKIGPWIARDFQKEILEDKGTRVVCRLGRCCGKTDMLIVSMLHKAFTNPNSRILYFAPYEMHLRLFFATIREIIDNSPLLKGHVVKFDKSNCRIELDNGSVILGYLSNKFDACGLRADWIYCEEFAYMENVDEFWSIINIIACERPKIGITIISTPKYAEGVFYRLCMDKSLGYHEHHATTMARPDWDADMDAFYRAMLTPEEYKREILAEFVKKGDR